jgi:hypothetical protein
MTTALTFSRIESGLGKRRAASVAAALVAALVAGAAVGNLASRMPAENSSGCTPTAGVFTGRYANGVPVYLLPPVSVVAIRKTEIAKMEREEQRAHASYGRADDAAHRSN